MYGTAVTGEVEALGGSGSTGFEFYSQQILVRDRELTMNDNFSRRKLIGDWYKLSLGHRNMHHTEEKIAWNHLKSIVFL